MRSGLLAGLVVATLSALSLNARAADLPQAPYPPTFAQPIYNWTGFYVGANGGYAWGQQDPLNIITNRFDRLSIDFSGAVLGGTVGAQIQSGHVVLGLEADLDWANLDGSSVIVPRIAGVPLVGATINASTNISWESTARARVGYANDNWLFYATGGLAVLGAKTNLATVAGGAVCTGILNGCAGANKQLGAALGGGVEYGFAPNWSAKVEYLHVTGVSLDVSRHNEIRFGVNYRFGGN
jgi:outer membrane immunogenic protein